VNENDVTVDWFYARGRPPRRIRQFALAVVGWFFALLPVVITGSALIHRGDGRGWWHYPEGYAMWDFTTRLLEYLLVVFIIGFLALFLANRASAARRDREKTYDTARLALRLELAEDMYAGKYGSEPFRLERQEIVIEPYEDVETYELRDRYREYGVD
jgi:hypothetical protein